MINDPIRFRRSAEVRQRLIGRAYGDGADFVEKIEVATSMPRKEPFIYNLLPNQFTFWSRSVWPFCPVETSTLALDLLRAENPLIAGLTGAVFYPSGWVDQTHLAYVNFASASKFMLRDNQTIFLENPSHKLSGRYFLGFNSGFRNYAHWVVDQLPALFIYSANWADTDVKLILPKVSEGHFIRQTVNLLGINEESIEYIDDALISVDELYFISHVSWVQMPRIVSEASAALLRRVSGNVAARHRRLYVARPDSSSRRLLNEPDILARLTDLDLEVVAPGLMSMKEQIEMFSEAELVVGPHGAGMANIAFCQSGTTVVEIFSEYTVNPSYWNLASWVAANYGFVTGTSFDEDSSLSEEGRSWGAPYVADPQLVSAAIRTALGIS